MHSHGSGAHTQDGIPRVVTRALAAVVIACMLVALAGTIILWPSRSRVPVPPGIGGPTHLIPGTVDLTRIYGCRYDITPDAGGPASTTKPTQCETSQVSIHAGPERGQLVSVDTNSAAGTATLHTGDQILLTRDMGPNNQPEYQFVDFQRGRTLAWLAVLFAILVVAVARWRGIGALFGLGITWLVLVRFLLPALLDGRDALSVALVASALILCLVLFIAHGVNARTATALLGTLASLILVGLIGAAAVSVTRLSGLATEEAPYLQSVTGIQLQGLLLAGMIIGSLGVLNDMTVTQSSAVWEIHLANPARGPAALYRAGMRVGRDHIASTVYTLVLAYAGAALPLLLSFDLGARHFSDVVTSEIVAEEVVRTLIGSVGLVACVPLTTALAAIVVTAAQRQASAVTAESPSPTDA